TKDGTAKTGSNYRGLYHGHVTIPAGQTWANIPIPVYPDAAAHTGLTFTITLSGPINAVMGASTATVTIAYPLVSSQLPLPTIANLTQSEGLSGFTPFTFQIGLPSPATAALTYDVFTTDGTAVSVGANPNFVPLVPGVNNPPHAIGTVTFAPGQTQQTITVYVLGGSIPETAGTTNFFVSLS